MDNQSSIQGVEKPNNQNKGLYIILCSIGVVIIALVLCIVFLVPHVNKTQNRDLLQQAEQLDAEGDKCPDIIKTLGGVDESILDVEEKIKYYRYLFLCYNKLGDNEKGDAYYLILLDIMNEQGLTSGG